jgi:hypothetical protein
MSTEEESKSAIPTIPDCLKIMSEYITDGKPDPRSNNVLDKLYY